MTRRISFGLGTIFYIGAVLLSLCFSPPSLAQPYSSGSLAFHSSSEEPNISATWTHLENRDDSIDLTYPSLTIKVSNQEPIRYKVYPQLHITVNGKKTAVKLPARFIGPKQNLQVPITFPRRLLKLDKLEFSGRLLLSIEYEPADRRFRQIRSRNRLESGSLTLPRLYFHPQNNKIKLYRADILRKKYGAGNFRNRPLKTIDPSQAFRRALAQANLSPIEPALTYIHHSQTIPGTGIIDNLQTPGLTRFCLAINGVEYFDSDFDEDFGKPGDMVPLSRGWVAMGQQGNPIYTGFLDANGCTPAVAANRAQEVSAAFFPLYLNSGPNIRGFVSDLNLSPPFPEGTMPWELFFFSPEADDTTIVTVDDEYMYTIFAAAANSMEKARGGLSNVLYEFRLRRAGDMTSTATNYAADGHPQVGIKFSTAAARKFTISHEYGHALHIAPLNPAFTPHDLDSTVEPDQSDTGHTINTKEWQLTAAFEGFAHYVAGLIWNEALPDQGAIFGRGSESILLDQYDQAFANNFDPNQFPNQGIERDWAQFFWNFGTDAPAASNGNTAPPNLAQILQMWLDSYQWPVNGDFFSDFRNTGVPAASLQRYDSIANNAGVNP